MRHLLRKNRGNRIIATGLIGTMLAISNVSQAQVIVTGDLDVDNYAQVYTGDAAGASVTPVGGAVSGPNSSAAYNFNTTDDFLYIAAWSDNSTQQGLLHDFAFDGNPAWSGDPAWEVYATGIDLNATLPVPTATQLGAQIVIANAAAGGAGTSVTWVAPTVGGINDGNFPAFNSWVQQASIATNANWVWYDNGNQVSSEPPFQGGFDHDEYLIFRTQIIPEPASAVLIGLGSLLVLARRRAVG